MPIIECVNAIFTEESGPYTFKDIVRRTQNMYSPHLTRTAIYRAHGELRKSTVTALIVAPLDPDASELLYSHEAARRIARKVINNRLPAQIKPTAKPKIQTQKVVQPEFETKVGLQRDAGGNVRFSFT